MRFNGKMVGVHRVAWQITKGPIPDGMQILHSCDVPICCNPNHLFLGSNDDNHADKAAKDRGRKRLTLANAKEVHNLHASGLSQLKIARMFHVRQSTISRIISGKRRKFALPLAN